MNTSTKQTENLAKCSDKSKPLLVAVTCQLTERGFSTKNRDKVNDDRLGIKLSFTNEVGKYVEIYDEDTYLHILHYGFDGKYLPIGFDVLFIKDIKKYGAFLDGILANCL
jgi:hypothetical protein